MFVLHCSTKRTPVTNLFSKDKLKEGRVPGNIPGTFHFRNKRNINVVDNFLRQLPEITLNKNICFTISVVYVAILVHLSLEIPQSLEGSFLKC